MSLIALSLPLAARWTLVAALVVGLSGCSQLLPQKQAKYQTVSANTRHDTATAEQKHRAALVFLEDAGTRRDFRKAEQLLNEALVADVTYGPAHNSMGTLYFMQNKLYLAAWEFEYAAKLMPDLAQPYNNLGLVYERVGKYDEAISYYSMALSQEEHNPQVIGNLVRTRMITGDKSPELKDMISDLALNHPQLQWQNWARDQVHLTRFDEASTGLPRDWRVPDTLPEALPEAIQPEDVLLQPESLRLPLPAGETLP